MWPRLVFAQNWSDRSSPIKICYTYILQSFESELNTLSLGWDFDTKTEVSSLGQICCLEHYLFLPRSHWGRRGCWAQPWRSGGRFPSEPGTGGGTSWGDNDEDGRGRISGTFRWRVLLEIERRGTVSYRCVLGKRWLNFIILDRVWECNNVKH